MTGSSAPSTTADAGRGTLLTALANQETNLSVAADRETVVSVRDIKDWAKAGRVKQLWHYDTARLLTPDVEFVQRPLRAAIALRLGEIAPLQLTLLGGVRAARDGAPIELAPRLQAIVVLLALGQGRERIADLLWPELAPGAARNNLHVNLNKLRRAVEPWGVATHVGEAALLHATSDVEAVEQALREGDAGRVAALFAGELAPGLDLEPVREARERLHRAVVACLANAAAALPPAEAEPLLARVLELEPLHEPAMERLLRLLAGSGRRARAIELYEGFRERLGNEVGARPLPATRAAVDAES